MRLSARNQLNATVEVVKHGEVMSTVKVVLPDGQQLTAAITREKSSAPARGLDISSNRSSPNVAATTDSTNAACSSWLIVGGYSRRNVASTSTSYSWTTVTTPAASI